jgi:arginase
MAQHAHDFTHAASVALIGAASCLGARDQRCDFGPQQVQRALEQRLANSGISAQWRGTLRPRAETGAGNDAYAQVAELSARLASVVADEISQHRRFAVIGGDHSCAIGTWSGAAVARRKHGPIGLIWIDAHMDSHTPQTSRSGTIHGMPLACLLGHGDPRLVGVSDVSTKLQPAYIAVIGVRSYEPEEQHLLSSLGVHVFDMQTIRRDGLDHVMRAALNIVRAAPGGYGISIDLDAIDPVDAPGVGSPEPGGIPAQALLTSLALVRHDPALLGVEIAELNPFRDRSDKTTQLTLDLLSAML